MRRGRMAAVVAVVGVLASALLGAAGARAAAPVFFTKAAVGAKAQGVSFTATYGAWLIEDQGGGKLSCKGATGTGEVTGPTSVANVKIVLSGCEESGIPCENGAPGEIVTETLAGSLGNVTATMPGIRLFNQAEGKGGTLAEYTCAGGAIKVRWKGSVIGSLSGASGTSVAEGKLATVSKLSYSMSKAVQKYVKFLPGEGEPGEEQIEENTGAGFDKLGISVIETFKTTPFAGQLGYTK